MGFFNRLFKRPPAYSADAFNSQLANNQVGAWDEITMRLKKEGKDYPTLIAPFETTLKNKLHRDLMTKDELTPEKIALLKKNVTYLLTCRPDLIAEAFKDKEIQPGSPRNRSQTLCGLIRDDRELLGKCFESSLVRQALIEETKQRPSYFRAAITGSPMAKKLLWKHYYKNSQQWSPAILNHFDASYICQFISKSKVTFDQCLKNRSIRRLLIDDLRKVESPFRNTVSTNVEISQWLFSLYERAPKKWPSPIFQAFAQPTCTALLKTKPWPRFWNKSHLANLLTGEQLTERLLNCTTREEQTMLAKTIFSRERDFLARIKRPTDWAQLLDARVDGAGTACHYYCHHIIRTDAESLHIEQQIRELRQPLPAQSLPKTPTIYYLPLQNNPLNDSDHHDNQAVTSTPIYSKKNTRALGNPTIRPHKLEFLLSPVHSNSKLRTPVESSALQQKSSNTHTSPNSGASAQNKIPKR